MRAAHSAVRVHDRYAVYVPPELPLHLLCSAQGQLTSPTSPVAYPWRQTSDVRVTSAAITPHIRAPGLHSFDSAPCGMAKPEMWRVALPPRCVGSKKVTRASLLADSVPGEPVCSTVCPDRSTVAQQD